MCISDYSRSAKGLRFAAGAGVFVGTDEARGGAFFTREGGDDVRNGAALGGSAGGGSTGMSAGCCNWGSRGVVIVIGSRWIEVAIPR